jgi:hypothetical protein
MIDTNPFFSQLSILSKYYLVYEAMYQEQYFPGELVMSMDSRSALNDNYKRFYKDEYTFFHMDIE